jgi:hypothetical protein
VNIVKHIAAALRMFREVLREIFDESAYERFLAQREVMSSAGTYAEFCRSQEQWKVRRPRCC